MTDSRSNILEQLTTSASGRNYRETLRSVHRSFAYGDIPDTFRRIYEVSDYLAARESLSWIQIKHRQELAECLNEEKSGKKDGQVLSPALEERLYDFAVERREQYMQRMNQLLELYAKSGLSPLPKRHP